MKIRRTTLSRAPAKIGAAFYPRGSGEFRKNMDVLEGKGKEMRGQIKEWWGKLTDDDLEQAGGNAEQVVGLLHVHRL